MPSSNVCPSRVLCWLSLVISGDIDQKVYFVHLRTESLITVIKFQTFTYSFKLALSALPSTGQVIIKMRMMMILIPTAVSVFIDMFQVNLG